MYGRDTVYAVASITNIHAVELLPKCFFFKLTREFHMDPNNVIDVEV